ncbi:MAG: sulfatase-like hydrolase/transferase, partial [Treponema sp.]|nr:sulfatase-like hydrolase/transferase [Treponema sp.]
HLSKNKKNVVVMFFDCAINSFLPYILEEEPELKEQLSGFTYYPNTLSFARNTSYCTPSMMGGYEYTPLELNKRTEVLLREKHNEATLVLPKLFLDAGYSVSVYDPPLPNYSYRGDLSAFENYQEIYVYETYGKFTDSYIADKKINSAEHNDDLCKSRMITFFAMRMLPPVLRLSFYGNCKKIKQNTSEFYNTFAPLYYLSDMTDAVSDNDTYIFFGNEVSHAPLFLDNDYEIESESNNSHCIYPSSNPLILRRYHANIAALKQFGKWINKLRELGVYDNTRIILVSDHGYDDEFILYDNKSYGDTRNISRFNPLLLFKDFDSNGELVTDNQFMTNADTIFLAKQNLDVSNINPFTNKELKQDKKYEGITVYPTYGQEMYVEYLKDKTQFTLKDGYFVKNNIFDKNNWQPLND